MKWLEHIVDGRYVIAFELEQGDYRLSLNQLLAELRMMGAAPVLNKWDVPWAWVKIMSGDVKFISTSDLAEPYIPVCDAVLPSVIKALNNAALEYGRKPSLSLAQTDRVTLQFPCNGVRFEFFRLGAAMIYPSSDSERARESNWFDALEELDLLLYELSNPRQE